MDEFAMDESVKEESVADEGPGVAKSSALGEGLGRGVGRCFIKVCKMLYKISKT